MDSEYKAKYCYSARVRPPRSCTISLCDSEGVTHSVQVQASSLYEAAARGVAAFREQGWAAEGLTPSAVVRVEVQVPPVVHEVPLRVVERWLRSPSASPREAAAKTGAASAPVPKYGGR